VCPGRDTHLTSSSTPGSRPTPKLRLRSPSPQKRGHHTLIVFLYDVIIAAGGHVDLNLTLSTVRVADGEKCTCIFERLFNVYGKLLWVSVLFEDG